MENRKNTPGKQAPLPHDFLEMVAEVFTNNFEDGLKALAKIKPEPRFVANGSIHPDEVYLGVSLMHGEELAATTVHASCDFDPKASAPKAEDLLSACVDAAGGIFGQLLDPKHPELIEQLAADSLSAFENIPFEWTEVEIGSIRVYLRMDKSNPKLEQMAEDWLDQKDPERVKAAKDEHKATEDLFVTGPSSTKKPGKPTLH